MKRVLLLLVAFVFGTATLSTLAAQGYIEQYLQDEKPIYVSGYRSYLDIQVTVDEFSSSGDACLHAVTSQGYLHRECLYVGAGTGLIWGIGKQGRHELAVPVFGEIRGLFGRNSKVQPYVGLRLGAAFEVMEQQRYRDGKIDVSGYLEPILGVEFGRYHAAISYMNQNLVAQSGNGITVSLGFRFGN